MRIQKLSILYVALLISSCLVSEMAAHDQASKKSEDNDLPVVKHLIDTHIHLYDPRRKDGVPWPPKDDKVLYKPHLPKEFAVVSKKAGVTGVVIVEASDRLNDNSWVLDLVKDNQLFVGLVGNINPFRTDFAKHLDKLAKDKRLVGLRARVQGRPIDYEDQQVLKNFSELAQRGLTLDILMNGEGKETILRVEKVASKLPNLKIVVNHVLGYNIDGELPGIAWIDAVKKLSSHKNVYVKVSGLYQRCTTQPATQDVEHYRELLDILWNNFGEDRVIYGSNWPCTKKSGSYVSFVKLVNKYVKEKGQNACEKYFWKNASTAYGLGLK